MKGTLRRWLKRLLILAVVLLGIWGLRATVFRTAPVPVTVYHADLGRVEATVVNSRSGTVRSRNEADLSPERSGRVVAIHVHKGDRVKAGQILLELDNTVESAQVELSRRAEAVADAAAEEACLTAAQRARDWERTREVAEQGLLSTGVLEEAETVYQVAQALCQGGKERVSQAKAASRVARATLAKSILMAPFNGVLVRVDTEVGEWVTPAAPGLFIPSVISLVDPDHLYVTAPLDEVDLNRVTVGLSARITMDALPGRTFDATLSWKSSRVETKELENRTLEVEATFALEADLGDVVSGSSADLEIILDSREPVLRIPSYAILAGGRVLVLKEGVIEDTRVESGLKNWEFTEITSGLSEGDAVIVSLDRSEVKAGARAVESAKSER